jgi:hypothetical protein
MHTLVSRAGCSQSHEGRIKLRYGNDDGCRKGASGDQISRHLYTTRAAVMQKMEHDRNMEPEIMPLSWKSSQEGDIQVGG